MKRLTILLIVCLCFSGCAKKPTSSSNDTPRTIATSAAVCEILDKLEIELVGVPDTTAKLPSRYEHLPRVGLPMAPDIEIIKALRPTNVITPNSLMYDLKAKYEAAGINSTFVNLSSVDGMYKSIEEIGEKYNRMEQVTALLTEYEAYLNAYNAKIVSKENPRVLILMGLPGSYMVATEKSYIGSLVKLAGGINVISEGEAFLNLNTEALLQTNSDIILRSAHGMPAEVLDMFQKEFAKNDIWKHFKAVQNNSVYDLDYGIFGMSANLSYTEALNYLFSIFYGGEN